MYRDDVDPGYPNVSIRVGGKTAQCEVRTKYKVPNLWDPITPWRVQKHTNTANWLIRLYPNMTCEVFNQARTIAARLAWSDVPRFIKKYEW